MARILSGSGLTTVSSMNSPRNLMLVWFNSHFSLLSVPVSRLLPVAESSLGMKQLCSWVVLMESSVSNSSGGLAVTSLCGRRESSSSLNTDRTSGFLVL